MKQKLVVILGPTGTGKTALGIKLCQKFNGEIISADSRQVYKGADIGTNKTESGRILDTGYTIQDTGYRGKGYWVQERVKIHFYDVTTPDKQYSASQFVDQAGKVVHGLWQKDKLPFVVGGTGFYISTLLGEVKLSSVPAHPQLRAELEKSSLANLQASLKTLAPEKFRKMNPSEKKNKHRLVRAIEVASATKLRKEPIKQNTTKLNQTKILKVGLTAPRKFLYQKADLWAKFIAAHGLIEETRKLTTKGYKNTPLLQGMIYQQALDFIKGELSKEEMVKRIQFELHGYIRRQLTWFKRDKKIKWLDVSGSNFDKKAEKLVRLFLKEG